MSNSSITIRRLTRETDTADWPYIRSLCCATGSSGQPIERQRFPFFAELWVASYQRLAPDWAYVAEATAVNSRVGYLTGCADSRSFNLRKALLFTFPLFLKTIAGAYPKNQDTRRFLRRFLRLERGPERRFRRQELRRICSEYPAHLHMNVDAQVRKAGVGRKLIEQFEIDLRAQKVCGIHLFCGEGPLRFYGKNGFKELAKIEFSPGVWVYALGKRLALPE